jgi:hypothetical protein
MNQIMYILSTVMEVAFILALHLVVALRLSETANAPMTAAPLLFRASHG